MFGYFYVGRLGGEEAGYGVIRSVVVRCMWLFGDSGGVVRGLLVCIVCVRPMCERVRV